MDELFIYFFLSELRKAGLSEASHDKEQDRVVISPKYPNLYVTYEDGNHLICHDKNSRLLFPIVRSVLNETFSLIKVWKQAPYIHVDDSEWFQKLLEWNGVVFAAHDYEEYGLHIVTWRCKKSLKVSEAKIPQTASAVPCRILANKSAPMPREKMFDDAPLDLICSALTYMLEHNGELYPETKKKIELTLSVFNYAKEETELGNHEKD